MVSSPKKITHAATSGAADVVAKDTKKNRRAPYLSFTIMLLVIVVLFVRLGSNPLKPGKEVQSKNTSGDGTKLSQADRAAFDVTPLNKGKLRAHLLPKNEPTPEEKQVTKPEDPDKKPQADTPQADEPKAEEKPKADAPQAGGKPAPQKTPVSKLATHVELGGQQVAVVDLKNSDLCGMTPVNTASAYQSGYLTKSAVMVGRNDGYGGHLIERVTAAIRFGLSTFDELILVDFNNSPGKKPIVAELPEDITTAPHFKSIVVSLEECAKLMGIKEERCNDYIYESLARNVGIEAATSDVIVSTNIDCIAPSREILDQMVREYMPTWRHAIVMERRPGDENWQSALKRAPKAVARNNSTATVSAKKVVELKKKKCVVAENYGPGPRVNFMHASVIMFVGDFQVGHRQLWEKADFRWAKNFTGRNSADSFLVMSWMNERASITVVDQFATHIEHAHTNTPPHNSGFQVDYRNGKFVFAGWNLPV